MSTMSNIKSLWNVAQGSKATVSGFSGISTLYLQRMREIGIDVGAEILCLNRPPFSAPRQFQICDGVFSLDKEIAASIQVASH
jgi:Fe2+ transport system protein FeoA